jgi:hypothetical protein
MRPFWSGRTMLCAPEGDGGGAGGNPPAPPPPPPAPAPEPKKDDPPKKDDGPLDTVVRDVTRIKKHIGLDEAAPVPTPAAKKKSGGLPIFSLFGDD